VACHPVFTITVVLERNSGQVLEAQEVAYIPRTSQQECSVSANSEHLCFVHQSNRHQEEVGDWGKITSGVESVSEEDCTLGAKRSISTEGHLGPNN
jgi:hypothetical protein